MPFTINCITLATSDLRQSFGFYSGLGLKTFDDKVELAPNAEHFALRLTYNLSLVIILRKDFTFFTDIANLSDAKAGRAESLLSYFASSKEEVDAILENVKALGGKIHKQPKSHPFGYAGYFTDPDKHLWEIMYNQEMLDRMNSSL